MAPHEVEVVICSGTGLSARTLGTIVAAVTVSATTPLTGALLLVAVVPVAVVFLVLATPAPVAAPSVLFSFNRLEVSDLESSMGRGRAGAMVAGPGMYMWTAYGALASSCVLLLLTWTDQLHIYHVSLSNYRS